MALERIWCLRTRSQDSSLAVFADETVYGTPEKDRNEEAHFIVIAKMTENEILTFITDVDNSDPLNELEYPFSQAIDGAYRLVEFNPPFYAPATPYKAEVSVDSIISIYANIVWATDAFYIAIVDSQDVEPGVTSGWATYWRLATEADFQANVSSNVLDTTIHDDIITFRYEDCLIEQLDNVNDDLLCGVCNKWEDLFKTLAMQLLLAGANANNWQDKQTKAEVIISQATKKFCC